MKPVGKLRIIFYVTIIVTTVVIINYITSDNNKQRSKHFEEVFFQTMSRKLSNIFNDHYNNTTVMAKGELYTVYNRSIDKQSYARNIYRINEKLQISGHAIQSLQYFNVTDELKELLFNRNCQKFPCDQSFTSNYTDIFDRRKKIMKEVCSATKKSNYNWKRNYKQKYLRGLGNLHICTIPKVGYTTWRATMKKMHIRRKNKNHYYSLTVRHPFERLASAYRDKFLNGRPISAYDSEWRAKTQSSQSWSNRWQQYWLPALISTRTIIATPNYIKHLSLLINIYDRVKEKLDKFRRPSISVTSIMMDIIRENKKARNSKIKNRPLDNRTKLNYTKSSYKSSASLFHSQSMQNKNESSFTPNATKNNSIEYTLIKTIREMLRHGNQYSFMYVSQAGYTKEQEILLKEKNMEKKFSFKEFLEHVIWTFDIGLEDTHWSTYQRICGVCDTTYDYILHLDNIDKESKNMFEKLGITTDVDMVSRHRIKSLISNNVTLYDNSTKSTKGDNNPNDYLKYYTGIPKSIIDKLRNIYFIDLLLFGYSIP